MSKVTFFIIVKGTCEDTEEARNRINSGFDSATTTLEMAGVIDPEAMYCKYETADGTPTSAAKKLMGSAAASASVAPAPEKRKPSSMETKLPPVSRNRKQ